jgi:hypothetical protein
VDTPRIQNTTGKSFDGSMPDYTAILSDSGKAGLGFMLDAGRTSAAVDTANENTLLRAQELQLQANNSAFDKLIAMTKLGVDLQDNVARNNISRQRNSIDWFQTALQADQNKMSLGLKMEELELARRSHNAEIGYKYAALNQGYGGLGGGGYGGAGGGIGGGGMGSSFGFNNLIKKSGGGSGSPAYPTASPTAQGETSILSNKQISLFPR